MTPLTIAVTVLAYFILLFTVSYFAGRKTDSKGFFGSRKSPWYIVAIATMGSFISGVTFVSVPGMVLKTDMTYLQTCLGFILGYFAVAFILLPVYYRLNLTTIYTYLGKRLGKWSYKTGASFFLLSKLTGSVVRFYVVCIILQRFVLDSIGVPFWLTVLAMVSLIWLYTRRGGIKTLVWTDTFQTTCMFTALILIIYNVVTALGMTPGEAIRTVWEDSHSKMFVFDDWVSRQNLEAVSQLCVHSYRDDRSRPGHDAEEPHLSHPARGPKGYVYLWLRFRSCQPSVSLFRCLACTTCAASGCCPA